MFCLNGVGGKQNYTVVSSEPHDEDLPLRTFKLFLTNNYMRITWTKEIRNKDWQQHEVGYNNNHKQDKLHQINVPSIPLSSTHSLSHQFLKSTAFATEHKSEIRLQEFFTHCILIYKNFLWNSFIFDTLQVPIY